MRCLFIIYVYFHAVKNKIMLTSLPTKILIFVFSAIIDLLVLLISILVHNEIKITKNAKRYIFFFGFNNYVRQNISNIIMTYSR